MGQTGSGGKVTQHPHTSSAVIDKHASAFFAQMSECRYCWLSLFILMVSNSSVQAPLQICCVFVCTPGKKLNFQFSELEMIFPYYDSMNEKEGGKEGNLYFYPGTILHHHRANPPLSITLAACVSLRFLSTQGLNAICSNTLRTWPKSGHIMTLWLQPIDLLLIKGRNLTHE